MLLEISVKKEHLPRVNDKPRSAKNKYELLKKQKYANEPLIKKDIAFHSVCLGKHMHEGEILVLDIGR